MQVAAIARSPHPTPSSAAPSAPPADLTQLAVAQSNAKATLSAGAALAQSTGELTGVLVDISA